MPKARAARKGGRVRGSGVRGWWNWTDWTDWTDRSDGTDVHSEFRHLTSEFCISGGQPEKPVHSRGGEEDAVEHIEQAAHAGDDAAGVLDVGGTLEERFGQVADEGADGKDESQADGAQGGQAEGFEGVRRSLQPLDQQGAREGADEDPADDAFP